MNDKSLVIIPEVSLAEQTDQSLIALTELVRDQMINVATNDLRELQNMRDKDLALSGILERAIKGHDAKLEACNNLAEGRLYVEHQIGVTIPEMRERGLLLKHGQTQKYIQDTSTLADYSLSRNQARLYTKIGENPLHVLSEYSAMCRENGLEISTAGFMRYAALEPDGHLPVKFMDRELLPPFVDAAGILRIKLDETEQAYIRSYIATGRPIRVQIHEVKSK